MSEKIWSNDLLTSLPIIIDCVDNTDCFNIEVICQNGEFLQELSK